MADRNTDIRDFPGKRWINVILRTLHIGGLVLFGSALLGNGSIALSGTILLSSGIVMFAIDTWSKPGHVREIAGFGILIKLTLIGLATATPALALPAFWCILAFSTILAHAPRHVRHRRLF